MASTETGQAVLIDQQTGLPNRLQFETVYRFLFYGADRGVPLTFMMVQVDTPDENVLVRAARRMASSTRSSDLLAHLGDGRFVTLLQGCNHHGARLAADRVSSVLAGVQGMRYSIGLAAYREEMQQPSALSEAAEAALAKARAAGGGEEIVVA